MHSYSSMGTMRQAALHYGILILCSISMRAQESTTRVSCTNNLPFHDKSDRNIAEHAKSACNVSREYQDDTPALRTSEERLAYLLDHNGTADSMDYFYKSLRRASSYSRKLFKSNRNFTEVGNHVFGDLRISDEQRIALFGSDASSSRYKRTATQATIMPWPNGIIKYDFQYGQFSDKEKRDIRAAMDIWEHHTCIKFQLVSRKLPEDNYINIERSILFCDADLGWPGPGRRSRIQFRGDCLEFGTYLRKLGHAIGLVHEHNLPTRNQYIKVLWSNLNPDFEEGFQKYDPKAMIFYDNEYDLSSIMHYPVDKFQINVEAITMMVPDRWMLLHIGNPNRRMLSFSDVKMASRLYKCGRQCEGKVFCPRGGYVNQYCACYTADEYYRTYCMNNAAFEAECYKLVIRGECDPTSEKHHKLCSKACGFCPRFLPGQKVQPVPLDVCRDVYHEPMRCVAWAQAGLCEKSIFLKRYCAKSCNACGHYLNKCPNLLLDKQCDKAAKDGFCRLKLPSGDRARALCQSSCQSCMHVKRGDCKNNADEASCEERRKRGLCDLQPLVMFNECPATCNRCWFNAGDCENPTPKNASCDQFAAMNRCTSTNYRKKMVVICRKTCNTCVLNPFFHYYN